MRKRELRTASKRRRKAYQHATLKRSKAANRRKARRKARAKAPAQKRG